MTKEYKKFDAQHAYEIHNARLAKDPQIIEGGERPLVKLTFATESRSDRHSTMWWEAAVGDWQSGMASFMKKGDVFGLRGFPALRRWGDNDEKQSLELVRSEVFLLPELMAELKTRGWDPGADKKPAKAKKPARKIQSLDDDE